MGNELITILSQIDNINRRLAIAESKIPVSYGGVFNARLSLSSSYPVFETTNATTIFLTPYLGYNIGIYVPGSDSWHIRPLTYPIYIKITDVQNGTLVIGSPIVTALTDTSQFIVGMAITGTGIPVSTEILSIDSLTQITLNKNATAAGIKSLTLKMQFGSYDVLVSAASGKPKLNMVKWGTVNARVAGQEVVLKNGIQVYDVDKNYRYAGSAYIHPDGFISDNIATRRLWNYHNRVPRVLYCAESTNHKYGTTTWRKWNASDTNNRVDFIVGIIEDAMSSSFTALMKSGSDGTIAKVQPYYDGSVLLGSSPSTTYNGQYISAAGNATIFNLIVGYHYLQIYEYGNNPDSQFNDFTFFINMVC